MFYLASIINFLVGIGAGIGAFFLVRFSCRTFKKKRIAKGVGFSLAASVLIIIALTFLISGIGWLIIILK